MSRPVSLEELRVHLDMAQKRLAQEKASILALHPMAGAINHEEYAFAYVRAERMGMRIINHCLGELTWLPMQLDTKSEMLGTTRAAMKNWMKAGATAAPNAHAFGNDFIHALSRCALRHGWDAPEFINLGTRIAHLFRDLSCMIGIAYYCSWLHEKGIHSVPLTNPDNLLQTAAEFMSLVRSSEILERLAARDEIKKVEKKQIAVPKIAKKAKPALRLIHGNPNAGSYVPEPLPIG